MPGIMKTHNNNRGFSPQPYKTMAYVKNWLHCVWGTKNRLPFIKGQMKMELIDHIRINARAKEIHIDFINGHLEHIHCLIRLSPDQTLSKVIQLIKGESSYWINKRGKTSYKFEWADEYFAASVGEKDLHVVREYIRNQEEHHRTKSWNEEYNQYLSEHGFDNPQG
jgi:putative transposase